MKSMHDLTHEIDQVSTTEKWRLVNHILQSLEQAQNIGVTDWQSRLIATAGILADDPIERPPQLPLEEREMLE